MLMRAVDVTASAVTALLRALRPVTAPITRLMRLAGLRSQSTGPVPATTQFDGPVHTGQTGARVNLALGDHCRLGRGAFFETAGAARITLGQHVRINTGTLVVAHAGITIGDDCLIGEYVSIRDADHGTDTATPMRTQPHTAQAITIGRDVWLARGVVVLKGVTIGDGAIVGANSVVTKSIPAGSIAVGAPARVLRSRVADSGAAAADEVGA